MLLRSYDLDYDLIPAQPGNCICGGKRRSTPEIHLRAALTLCGVRSIIVLGGSNDVTAAFHGIPGVKAIVVTGSRSLMAAKSQVHDADLVVIARGEVSHSATAPYLEARNGLPKHLRPLCLYPLSSNITAIVQTLIWNRSEICNSIAFRARAEAGE